MKKIFYVFAILLFFCSIGTIGYFTIGRHENIKSVKKENNNIEIIVKGAVERPNLYIVKRNTSLREVLFMAKIRPDADLSQINMNAILINDETIDIPYINSKITRIHIKDYVDSTQLTTYKIPKNIAEKILELKTKNNKITWNDIDNLNGVGKIYLEKLKSILILDF
ncbi:MAG0490 family ComEA-like DNA-binding protein [Mycoplasma elephantis]|uniref:MAG0490 family ComEA-like DNA-binding protein n=1 Tax=Mycoplasma elephantis TaxID=114882 RepID=UPI000484B967|nr:hypothetical protein [Mycoplasma elephantis]